MRPGCGMGLGMDIAVGMDIDMDTGRPETSEVTERIGVQCVHPGRRVLAAIGLAVVLAFSGLAACAPMRVASGWPMPDLAELVQVNGAAVVNIGVERQATQPRRYSDRLQREPWAAPPPAADESSLGSGFIVNTDGFILTNAHVVARGTQINVKLTDRREFKARVIGLDALADVALLKIDASDLPTVRIGSPDHARVGEAVVAIGSPFGFSNTVTAGIISAKGRLLPGAEYMQFLQTDVPVNPGNSGGPLFNLQGEVIGINSRIYSSSGGYQGLSFAIPIDVAMRIKDQLQASGTVTRGRIGVAVQELNQALAASFGLARPAGALVSHVEASGAAAQAGLKSGDVILGVQGREVVQAGDALGFIADLPPGETARLRIWRDRAEQVVEAVVDRFDAPQPPAVAAPEPAPLGIVVRPLASRERQVLGIEAGLLVQRVNATASRAGVKAGDLIVAINGQPVDSVEALAREVMIADSTVALLVQRGTTRLFVPICAKPGAGVC